MSRWVALLPVVVLIALALMFGLRSLGRDPHVQPDAMVGKPMPDLALAPMDGGPPRRLREFLGEGPVLVNFFASWCGPCEVEHPQLLRMQAQGVRIIGVDYKDAPPLGSAEAGRAFVARLGNPYIATLSDPEGRAGIEFGVTGPPETYVVGRDGVILAKHVGALMPGDVRRLADLAR